MSLLILVVDDEPDVEALFRQQFRRDVKASRPDVPVVMITTYGDDTTKRKALEGGAEALLTLTSKIHAVVRPRSHRCRRGIAA
jgi:CheY-like chemotaxis protein